MARPQHKLIRWSAFAAALEFGVTVNKVKKGLAQLGIEPAKDGKWSTRDIAEALFKKDALEKKAKDARYQAQIDEAKWARDRRLKQEGELVEVSAVKETMADLVITYVGFIRRSKLSATDKNSLIKQLHEVKLFRKKD